MITPEFRTSTTRKICYWINYYLDHPLVRFLLIPIFFIVPISFLLTTLSDSTLLTQFQNIVGERIYSFLVDWNLCLVGFIYFSKEIASGLKSVILHYSKPNIELNRDDLVALLESIDNVVSNKMDRFCKKTKIIIDKKWRATRIFKEITQPDQQIALLTTAIHGFFEYMNNSKVELRVGLMRIKEEKPCGWFCFTPIEKPPQTSHIELSNPTSTIMRSIKARKTVVVEDIKKELKKRDNDIRNFVKGSTGDHDEGSIITYPIYCPNTREPIFVLSILADKPYCFIENHIEIYKWIIDRFVPRILLEHHLNLMKGIANE